MAEENCIGVRFRINDIGFPQWRIHEVGVVGVWSGAITLRRSQGRTRGMEAFRRRGHRGTRVGGGYDERPRGGPSDGRISGRHMFDEE